MGKNKNKKPKNFLESVEFRPPEINVIDKEIMDRRISEVFDQIANTLQRSLGPLGAHAIVSQAPNYHVTKDGFTIMKNIRYNSQYGYVDQVISGMIADICGRLNFAVGDGTTSAVLSANAMYQEFKENKETLNELFFLPRNVLNRTKKLTEDIIARLEKHAIDIKSLPKEEMCEYIRQVVYVSSNADVEMTDTIVDLYKEIGYPAISVVKAVDGVTKGNIVNGFMFHSKLMDRIYVNNDNNTQHGKNYDVLIFDHKVTINTYKMILDPLSYLCRLRNRKLICIAPNYDEVALQGDILNSLNDEYRRTHDINLVLMGYRSTRNSDKKRVSDLAMLCNTQLITQNIESELIKRMGPVLQSDELSRCLEFINLDNRCISGTKVIEFKPEEKKMSLVDYEDGFESYFKLNSDFVFRVGYCEEASLSIEKESVFSGFHYDKNLYDKYVMDAQKELDDVIEKYKRLGTFNFEVDDAQKRLLSLKLKMGQIEVGAKTDFSQEFLVDAMDDAVKAAESAYRNGIIKGGHTTLLRAIKDELAVEGRSEGDIYILNIIQNAFKHVRSCVLANGLNDVQIKIDKFVYPTANLKDVRINTDESITEDRMRFLSSVAGIEIRYNSDVKKLKGVISHLCDKYKAGSSIGLFDLIIEIETYSDTVLDLDMTDDEKPYIEFNTKVINSTATDREILIASADLVGLLTTGNQLVISRGNYA